MSHKPLDFNRAHKPLLLRTGHIPKTNLVLSRELQAALQAEGKVQGKGKFCSQYAKLILFWMKIANNYSKHKVQNKNMAAFKKLVIQAAYTLLQYKSSKYIKFNIKSPEQRFFA